MRTVVTCITIWLIAMQISSFCMSDVENDLCYHGMGFNGLFDAIKFGHIRQYKSWAKPFHRPTRKSIIMIMLLMCGDVEMNPGPVNDSIYPCGYCELQVGWSRRALCCDSCSLWYHKTCLSMASDDYARLEENASMSWHCLKCHTPLSDTYLSYDIPVENMFDTLASIPGDDTVFNRSTVSASSPLAPLRHSSPWQPIQSHQII